MAHTERKSSLFVRWSFVVVLLAAPGWAAAQSPDGIVVFGTSLSDPGNAFAIAGEAGTPPDFTLNPFLIPSAPYAKGGHHFSNGATWIEQYAWSIGLGDSVGAARAYNDGINFNLGRQVDTFLLRTGGVASPQSLYVIEMGSNDIRDAFQIYAVGGNGGRHSSDQSRSRDPRRDRRDGIAIGMEIRRRGDTRPPGVDRSRQFLLRPSWSWATRRAWSCPSPSAASRP